MGRIAFVFSLALVFSGHLSAQQAGNPVNWCRGGSFPHDSESFRIGKAIGNKGVKIHFYNDLKDDCPQSENCRDRSYIVPGDKVVVSRSWNGFACSWYTPVKGMPTVGWIKLKDLKLSDPRVALPIDEWLGDWAYADNTITFTHNKLAGHLNATGEAFWKGLGDNIHIGELDDRVEPKGNIVKVGERDGDEFACKATVRLIDIFLVVADNMKCGGANVSFSGVYRKKR